MLSDGMRTPMMMIGISLELASISLPGVLRTKVETKIPTIAITKEGK